MKLGTALMAVTALAGVAGAANAGITIYTSQSAYLAAIANAGTDTFNTLPLDFFTSPIVRTAGSYGYTATAANGFYGAGSSADAWLSTNFSGDDIVFSSFTGGVYGVGGLFFGSDISGAFLASASMLISATDASGTVTQTLLNPTTSSFVGFVSTSGLFSLTVSQPDVTIWNTINNLTLGGATVTTPAVPEPASWAMMIGGLGLVGAGMRRKAASVAFA